MICVNIAVTDVAAIIVTVQGPVPAPLQGLPNPPVTLPKLQPLKLQPLAAVAVSVTDVPAAKPSVHVDGQLMPAGEPVTVPPPAPPDTLTVSV